MEEEDKNNRGAGGVEAVSGLVLGVWAPAFAAVLIVAAAILAYWSATDAPFMYDDRWFIVDNPAVKDPAKLHFSASRYVTLLTFALNYAATGTNPFGYHLVNLLIHIINGMLVWALVVVIYDTPAMKGAGVGAPSLWRTRSEGVARGGRGEKYFIALAAALLFTAHPVQTQAVTYITQRFTSLAALFYLLSVVCYIWARLGGGRRPATATAYVGAVVAARLAMKTKEISVTLPATLLLFEYALFPAAAGKTWVEWKRRFLLLTPFLAAALIVPFTFLYYGHHGAPAGMGAAEAALLSEQLRDVTGLSARAYLFTQFPVLTTYIRLLFYPHPLHFIYDYPVYTSFFHLHVVLSFVFLSTILLFAVALLVMFSRGGSSRDGSKKGRSALALLASISILWFFITISVESTVIPIKAVIAEHRLYLPSVGAFVAVSCLLASIFFRPPKRRYFTVQSALCLILVLTVVLSAATFKRNKAWQDGVTFWTTEARYSPGRADVLNNLGAALWRAGRYDDAVESYRRALLIWPGYANAHNNLGVALMAAGDYEGAVGEYMTAIMYDANKAEAYHNMGLAYETKGHLKRAAAEYRRALVLRPDYIGARISLGIAIGNLGDLGGAAREFKRAIVLDGENPKAHYHLGVAMRETGDAAGAEAEFERALEIDPDFREAAWAAEELRALR